MTRKKVVEHTRGPWKVDEFDGRIYIVAADDPMLYVTEMINPKDDPEGSYQDPRERIANAYLIAASPEMLKLIKGAVLQLPANCGWVKAANRLIAQTKGKL